MRVCVAQYFGDLPSLQTPVASAFEMRIVDGHPGGSRAQGDAAAAARLDRINRPAPPVLRTERNRRRVLDHETTQDCLPGESGTAIAGLTDLLKFTRADPVHVQRGGQVARHVALTGAIAILIDFL